MDYSLLIIVFSLGFVSHFISSLVGGGGLISLPTMLLMGIPIHNAIASDKFGAAVSTFFTTVSSIRKKEIAIAECLSLLTLSLVSGFIGGAIASNLPGGVLNIIALILMTFAFIMTFMSATFFGDNHDIQNKKKVFQLLSGVGFYDGLFGPGSSTLAIYVFSNDRMKYYRAVLLTRICLFGWCVGALISYISAGHMIWSMAFAIAGGAILGGYAGVHISKNINLKYIKPLLRIMTLFIIIQLIIKMI